MLPGEGLLLFGLGLLLRLAGRLQLFQPFLLLLILLDPFSPLLELHLLEHGIVPLVVPELALVQVDDVRAHIVQKALVVGHCTQILKQNK